MRRQHPRSTLFPYTTLFRSEKDIQPGGFFTTYMSMFGDPFRTAIEPLIPSDLKQPEFSLPFAQGETWFYTGGPHGGWNAFSGDRKSTRLNSSHRCISYAVFC